LFPRFAWEGDCHLALACISGIDWQNRDTQA
jgi:hypothetical protein